MSAVIAAPVVRTATPADERAIAEVFAAARATDLAGLPPALVDLQLRAQAAQIAREYPDAEHSVIEVGDGFGALVVVGRVVVDAAPSRIRLVDIAVLPQHQRRGLGSGVLTALCARADAAASALSLTVWAQNTGARRLYERFGFVDVEATETYVTMHREAAA